MPNRVLIIASHDESREAAMVIAEELKSNGYSVELSNSGKDSKISADRAIAVELSLADYKGVAFLDDGGDAKASLALAKQAHEEGLVVGGFASGCAILGQAKLLKDQYAPESIAQEYDGKAVNAPAARSGDIVSAVGSCPMGFVMLLIDALGGEVKHVVIAGNVADAMVVSDEPWTTFWPLVSSFASHGATMLVAQWDDIDITGGVVSGVLVGEDARPVRCQIPKLFWLQQEGVTAEQVKTLEAIGRSGVSTSSAIERASSATEMFDALALVFPQAKPMPSGSIMTADVMASSFDVLSSSGKRVARIMGKGDYAIVTKAGQNLICSRDDVAKFLAEGPLVKVVESVATLTGKELEFGFMMLRVEDGWKEISSAAYVGNDSYPVSQAATMGLGSHLAKADLSNIAMAACGAIEKAIPGIRDLAIFVSATDSGPAVRAEPTPIYSRFVPKSSLNRIAQMMGMDVSMMTDATPRADQVSDAIIRPWEKARLHKALLEREMAREGIWPQPDASMAIDVFGETKRLSLAEAIEFAGKSAIKMLEREARQQEGGSPIEAKRARLGALRARHRLMLLLAYAKSQVVRKTAGIYGTSIAGPYANLDLPWSERVMEWREGDDWLTDRDKALEALPRYNPEYERTSDKDEFGMYYRWDDERREPYYWIRRFTEGIYPMRNMLQNNPRGN